MRIEARVMPAEGISDVTDVLDDAAEAARQQKNELLLLNAATAIAVMLVSCAWLAMTLD